MTSSPRPETGIKELAYHLASAYGWDFSYEGGMELEGEYIDDAELTRTINGMETVVTICWDETSSYSLTVEKGATAASFFAQGSSGSVEFERYNIAGIAELEALARQHLQALNRQG